MLERTGKNLPAFREVLGLSDKKNGIPGNFLRGVLLGGKTIDGYVRMGGRAVNGIAAVCNPRASTLTCWVKPSIS